MDTAELVLSRAFLGNEFMTWLLVTSERNEGKFGSGEDAVTVFFEDQLVLEAVVPDAQADTFKGGTPSTSPEARTGLQGGKKVGRAKLRLAKGDRDWNFSMKGRTLDLSSIKLPALMTKAEDDRFFERMALLEEIDAAVDALYRRFLELRLTKAWAAEEKLIKEWIATPAPPQYQ